MPSGIDKRQATALRLALQRMPKEVTVGVRRAVKDGGELLADEMRQGYRFHRQTGQLEANVVSQIRSNGLVAQVGFPGAFRSRRARATFYAFFLERGTRYITASPVQKQALQQTREKIVVRLESEVDKALETFARG